VAHHGNTDEIPWLTTANTGAIPRLTVATQVKFRGLIKSGIDKSNTGYELMNPSLSIN